MNNNDDRTAPESIDGIPVMAESIGFSAEELAACPKCGRMNAPDRLRCLYCGGEVSLSSADSRGVKLNLRVLETWEKGFNVIHRRGGFDIAVRRFAEIRGRSISEDDAFGGVLVQEMPIPIARVESESEAAMIVDHLKEFGVECRVVSDESLSADRPPVRLRSIRFDENRLVFTPFNSAAPIEIDRDKFVLIVTGVVIESRTEITEKRKKGVSKSLSEMQTSTDEPVIDIYSAEDKVGYRVPVRGFDFSCLGSRKRLLASENMAPLTERLREFSPSVRFCDEYSSVRPFLEAVWETERRTDSQGFQRSGFGKKELTKVGLENNLQQFTKFSRLQRLML